MSTIISIHSFRGGTGKSNTTANLAVTIAREGYRVGIVDTDIQSPGIHVLFGLAAVGVTRALNDYLWGHCKIEDAAYDVTSSLSLKGAPALGTLYLIPASIKPGEIARVLREGYDVSILNDGFHEFVRTLQLDYLLIDTHPGLNDETLLSIAISNVLVLILRPDQQDYQGTAVTVEVARNLEVPRTVLVVNKALPEFDFATIRAQVEGAYGVPVAAVLPLSEDMARVASSGIFCLLYPDHPISQEIRSLAAQIMA